MNKKAVIRFFGDFTTGENYQLKYENELRKNSLRQMGYDFLMKNCSEFLEDSYNIVNLETPITANPKSSLEHKKAVLHWSCPNVVPEFLKKYNINAVSLGNNHAYDYNHDGLVETINSLDKVNIEHFGAGYDIEDAKKPLIKSFKIGERAVNLYIFGGYKYREDYSLEFDFYAKDKKSGVFLLMPETIEKEILKIKKEDKNSLIIIFPHFGFDLQKTVSQQIQSARTWIDMGADFVIGHGPHIMHGIEYYKGKTIVYSLGNFVFNANFKGKGIPYNLICELELFEENDEFKIKQKLYPIYVDNNSFSPITRGIREDELDEVIKILTNDKEEIKEKIDIIKGRKICIEI